MMRFLIPLAAAAALAPCVFAEYKDIGYIKEIGTMKSRRSDADAETIGEMILVTGGCDGEQTCASVTLDTNSYCSCSSVSNLIEVYFPINNTWSSSEYPAMPSPRFRHNSIHFGELLYIFGGRNVSDTLQTHIDVLNITSETWTTVDAPADIVPFIGSDNSYWTVGQDMFVFAGGYDQNYNTLNSTIIVSVNPKNASDIRWTKGPDMPLPRGDFTAASLDSKTTLIIGGFVNGDFCVPVNSTLVFNASSTTSNLWSWSEGPKMPYAGADQAISFFEDAIYVFGGQRKDAECHSNNDNGSNVTMSYNVTSKSWGVEYGLPLNLFRFASAPWTAPNGTDYLFVIGGQGDSTVANGTRFNPVLDKVYLFVPSLVASTPNTSSATMNAASLSVAAVALLGMLYLM